MKECLIYENSLRFSRTVHGSLALIAFFLSNHYLLLITAGLMFAGAPSVKYNLFYQLHSLIWPRFSKDKLEAIKKESGELAFACGLGGAFLLISFFLLYFGKWQTLAWGLAFFTACLMLLAGFVGLCPASLIYALLKKLFKKQ